MTTSRIIPSADRPGRLVLHIDVDAFFASVEQLLIPRLRARPVAVGNGCIASCSYEARRFGLHAGMALWRAKRLCRDLVVLDGQYPIYRCFAERIWQICRCYTDALETFLDEAYGDVSGMGAIHGQPPVLGRRLQSAVREEVGLSVSIGLGANRMLAKLASKAAKPGGVRWIAPSQEPESLMKLPAKSLPGIGAKTAGRLGDMNITTVAQLHRLSRRDLRAIFGELGEVLYERCRGRDLQPDARAGGAGARRRGGKLPKTISRETTFHSPQCDHKQIRAMLFYLLERAMRTVRQAGLETTTVELTIRYDDGKQCAARRALPQATQFDREVFDRVGGLFRRLYTRRVALRHVGVVLSGLRPADNGPTLFHRPAETRTRSLHETIDAIRDRWGHAAVVTGESIDLLGRLRQNDYGFVLRTPSLAK